MWRPQIPHKAIDVEVDCGPGVPCRLLRVDIDVSEVARKQFLGGFKHRVTGSTYHHAVTQTPPSAPRPRPPPRACRDTQTVHQAARGAQTLREAATQMPRPGVVLDVSEDRLVTPRTYVTAREVQAVRQAAALTVQRFARGWAARRRAGQLRGHKEEREAFLREREGRRIADAEDARRCSPHCRAVFLLPLRSSHFSVAIVAPGFQADPIDKGP
jgi:hypothetical protein